MNFDWFIPVMLSQFIYIDEQNIHVSADCNILALEGFCGEELREMLGSEAHLYGSTLC